MWFTPPQNIKSMSGFICESEVRKCSVSQVKVSLEVKGLPLICAADEAHLYMEKSESFFRVMPASLRSPRMPKSVRPKPSISGMSTAE